MRLTTLECHFNKTTHHPNPQSHQITPLHGFTPVATRPPLLPSTGSSIDASSGGGTRWWHQSCSITSNAVQNHSLPACDRFNLESAEATTVSDFVDSKRGLAPFKTLLLHAEVRGWQLGCQVNKVLENVTSNPAMILKIFEFFTWSGAGRAVDSGHNNALGCWVYVNVVSGLGYRDVVLAAQIHEISVMCHCGKRERRINLNLCRQRLFDPIGGHDLLIGS